MGLEKIVDIGEYKRQKVAQVLQDVFERLNSPSDDLDNGNLHERYDYE